jgi:hypothetical protein
MVGDGLERIRMVHKSNMAKTSFTSVGSSAGSSDVAKRVTTSWLLRTFGERQTVAQPIAKSVLISPLINKDFPVRYPLLARGNFASVTLNHQK